MIYVLLVADAFLFVMTVALLVQCRNLLRKCKLILRMIEQHGGITDRQTARAEVMAEQVKEVARTIPNHGAEKHIIEEIHKNPEKTAVAVLEKLKDSSGSLDIPPPASK